MNQLWSTTEDISGSNHLEKKNINSPKYITAVTMLTVTSVTVVDNTVQTWPLIKRQKHLMFSIYQLFLVLQYWYTNKIGMQKQFSHTMSWKCHWCYHVVSTIILKSECINKTWCNGIVFGINKLYRCHSYLSYKITLKMTFLKWNVSDVTNTCTCICPWCYSMSMILLIHVHVYVHDVTQCQWYY